MKKFSKRRLFATASVLTPVLFALSTSGAKGQANPFEAGSSSPADKIIFNGNPPLTESMVSLYADYESWILAVRSSPQQLALARTQLLQDWKDPAQIKNDFETMGVAQQLAKQPRDDREFMRWKLQPLEIARLRADKRPYAQAMLAAYEQTQRPIAPGNPPLTESLVSRYTTFLFWTLEIPFDSTADQIAAMGVPEAIRELLLQDWKKPAEIKNDMASLNGQVDLAGLSREEREFRRSYFGPLFIKDLRSDSSNPAANALVAAYDAAHPVIAAGNPPLTRQAADAFTEILCFVQNQGSGQRLDCNQELKDGRAQQLSQTYGTLSPEQQKKLAEMPQSWALFRLTWSQASDADRQKLLAQWLPAAQSGPTADPQQVAANAAAERVNAFVKRDAGTVSEQDLLLAAQDADTAARECRREGGEQNLANAARWEQAARNFRMGKAAYAQLIANQNAQQEANNQLLLMMQLRNQQRFQSQMHQSLNTILLNDDVNMRNAAGNVNNSADHWEIQNGKPVLIHHP